MTRPAARRPAPLRLLLAVLLLLPLLALAPPAAAAPGDAPVSEDDASDPARPVRIDVLRLEPRAVVPGAPITVSGTLTNTGTETLRDLEIRLQRGEPLESRAALLAADTEAEPRTAAATPFAEVPGELAPGTSLPFLLTTTSDELGLDATGVFPVLINLNGAGPEGDRRRVGELSTYLVQQPTIPAAATTVAWLWPLTERTHRDAAGRFADDGLAESVAPGGRLDRALAVVEGLPRAAPPGSAEPRPVAPVTLAIDPALVEALAIMADGPYAVAGEEGAGEGTEDAAGYLDRLRAVAAVHPVVALPYGDADVDGLTAAGLGAAVFRTLPAVGTAQDPSGGVPVAPPTTEDGAPAAEEDPVPAGAGGAGVRILRAVLGVEARSDLAWPAGGSLRADTLATLQDGGITEVVLSPGGLTEGTRALGLDGTGAAARTTVTTAAGPVGVLVADGGLGALVGSAGTAPGGVRAAEQRYLAELALLSLHPPADAAAGQTVLVAPPREVDVDPDGVSAMIAATAELPWLRPGSVADLRGGPEADAGGLAEETGPVALDPAGLADVAAALAVRDDLAGAVVGDADAALAGYDAAAARATSVAWRDSPEGFRAAAADLRRTVDRLRGRVTLLPPAEGTYSLASSDSPLVLTVRNDLPFPVRVLLEVQPRGNVGLTVTDIGVQELAPGQRTTLQVPTELRQSGRFRVTATLTTPGGGPLGQPVELQVNSTAYGTISLLITFGAAGLLALLFLRRLVLFLLRRRRGEPGGDAFDPAPTEGAAVPLPPTRSPV